MTARVVNAADRRTVTHSYPAQRGQVRLVRAALAVLLDNCPVVGDAVLIASELAANAVIHSNSAAPGGRFTVRAEVCPAEYVRIEVDDQGGQWTPRIDGEARPHGLDLIDALVGAGNWGIYGDAEHGRTVWARVDWPALTWLTKSPPPGASENPEPGHGLVRGGAVDRGGVGGQRWRGWEASSPCARHYPYPVYVFCLNSHFRLSGQGP